MLNKTKIFITTIVTMLALATGVNATEIRVNRMLKLASTQPLLYRTAELLPKYAAEAGIPDTKVTFVDIMESSKANEALLLNQIDLIFGGASSFGILYDKDPSKVKILSGGEEFDIQLVCTNPAIKTLKDIIPTTKIAMKGMNGGEHQQLRQYAAAEFGIENAKKFDNNVVVMPRDQALAQMTKSNPEIDCGIIGTPWQNIAVEKGARIIAKVQPNKTVGTNNIVYSTTAWINSNPKLAEAWVKAQKQAIAEWKKNSTPMLETYLKNDQVTDTDVKTLAAQKVLNSDVYKVEPTSAISYIQFMYKIGALEGAGKDKLSLNDMVWKPELLK